jgi:uncharacterized protein YyaL (SSP411 family)
MLPEGIRGLVRERDMDVPSANSVSAMNLVRIETITGEATARAKSGAIFRSFAFAIRSAPQEHAGLIGAQEASGLPPRVVVIAGDSLKPETRALWKVVHESFSPRRALVMIGSDAERQRLATIVPAVKDLKIGKDATAWVCDAKGCSSGFTDPAKLAGVVSSEH